MERLEIENAAESVVFPAGADAPAPPAEEPQGGQPETPGAEAPVVEEPDKATPEPSKQPAAPKAPAGLDKLRAHFGAEPAPAVAEAEPEPKTAEGRIKQLVDRNAALERQLTAITERIDGLGQQQPARKPDLSAFSAKELVKGLKLDGMDPGAAEAFREDFGPAFAELMESALAQYVDPLKEQIAKQNARLGDLDTQDFEKELGGYLGDAWDEPTQKLVRSVLDKEQASEVLNNPRIASIFVLGVRSMYGMDALETIKGQAEKDLRGRMAATDLTPSRASAAPSDAPNRILLGDDYRAHKAKHGRDSD